MRKWYLFLLVVMLLLGGAGWRLWHGQDVARRSTFDLDNPSVLFLQRQADGPARLYRLDPGAEPAAVSPPDLDILDYALAPDGRQLALVVAGAQGGSDIWQQPLGADEAQLLVACQPDFCTRPLWHPMMQDLVLEQRPPDSTANTPPTLLRYDFVTERVAPIRIDTPGAGFGPQYSPDGRWFSFAAPLDHAIEMYDLRDEARSVVHIHSDQPIIWRPDSKGFLIVHETFVEGQFARNLQLATSEGGDTQNLSQELVVWDVGPAWSPDGEQIAFTRRDPTTPMGAQIWTMAADGTDARRRTLNTEFHHSRLSWSPTGDRLLYQRANITGIAASPEIWVLDVTTGGARWLANGYAPAWVAPAR